MPALSTRTLRISVCAAADRADLMHKVDWLGGAEAGVASAALA